MSYCVKTKCDSESRGSRFRRDVVTLVRPSTEQQDSGQPVRDPVQTIRGIRCIVRDVRGSEFKNANELNATVDFIVEMRYRTDIDPRNSLEVTRGKHEGKTLNVTAVLYKPDEGRPRETHCYCKYNATPHG